jgi:hypothetical protein
MPYAPQGVKGYDDDDYCLLAIKGMIAQQTEMHDEDSNIVANLRSVCFQIG